MDTNHYSNLKLKKLTALKIDKIIDCWPSHSINWSLPNGTEPVANISPQSIFRIQTNNPKSSVKPKFLEAVESRLRKRLEESGLSNAQPSLERLCIFREAFDAVILNFKTYQSLLIPIKEEYESVLQNFKDFARQLGAAQELLFSVTNEYERKITSHFNLENKEILSLKDKIKKLENKISRINEERNESRIVQANFQTKLENLSTDLLHELDARKLAIMDLNHLRNEYSDLLEYTKELSAHAIDGGDAVTLKIALERAKEAHTQSLNRIAYLESEYSDVVPKKEFEAVQTNLKDAETQLSHLRERCTQLESQLTAKTEELTSVLKERNDLSEKLYSMQRVSTPRPEWSRVSHLVPGGPSRWQQLTVGKSSQEKLVILSSELSGGGSEAALIQTRMDSQNLKPIHSSLWPT